MTQPFGSCDILFSASLALAAPATNVATAPRQVASSNLRITKPPTLFQVLFVFRAGLRGVQRQRFMRRQFRKSYHFQFLPAAIDSQETSEVSVNRGPIEAGNNQMLCPSSRACN